MRSTIRKSMQFALPLACFAITAFAGTATMDLTSAGNNTMGGVYVNPYTATINGVSTLVICDDYTDDSFVPEDWTANVTNMAALTSSSPVKWTGAPADAPYVPTALTQDQAYVVAAYLATEIIQAYDANEATLTCEYSFALWGLFDPAAFNDITLSQASVAEGYLEAAVQAAAGQSLSNYANVNIYTPVAGTATCPGYGGPCPGGGPPQEFLTVTTPEPASASLLAFDLSSLLLLVAVLGRRLTRSRLT